jgi:hypothetical protein
VERLREREVAPLAAQLRKQVSEWLSKQLSVLQHAEPLLPEELNDRQQDGAEVLLAIADAAGGDWPSTARRALVELYTGEEAADESHPIQLLADIKSIFDSRGDRIFSSELVDALAAIETSPWGDWFGRSMTKTQLARQLKEFKIRPKTIRIGDDVSKGYTREVFENAWARYLEPKPPSPGSDSLQGLQPAIHAGLDEISDRYKEIAVTGRKSGETPVSTRVVTRVTDENRGEGEKLCFVHKWHTDWWFRDNGAAVCGKCHLQPKERANGKTAWPQEPAP